MRAERVEAALRGETLDAARIQEASAEAHDEVEPLSDVHGSEQYRRELAVTLTRRAIAAAAEVETTVAKR